jgi:hypothetical protein
MLTAAAANCAHGQNRRSTPAACIQDIHKTPGSGPDKRTLDSYQVEKINKILYNQHHNKTLISIKVAKSTLAIVPHPFIF